MGKLRRNVIRMRSCITMFYKYSTNENEVYENKEDVKDIEEWLRPHMIITRIYIV